MTFFRVDKLSRLKPQNPRFRKIRDSAKSAKVILFELFFMIVFIYIVGT